MRLGVFLDTQTLKKHPSGHPKILWEISYNVNLKHIFELFHLHIIPMTLYKNIMPYFDKFVHVLYGWNLSILWSPLKIWTPKNLTIANFGHPISKSWLRLCSVWYHPYWTWVSNTKYHLRWKIDINIHMQNQTCYYASKAVLPAERIILYVQY